jgi:hypothetical protein
MSGTNAGISIHGAILAPSSRVEGPEQMTLVQEKPVTKTASITRIPTTDYATHPAYGKLFGKPAFPTRVAALRRLLPVLWEQAARRYKNRHRFPPMIAPGQSTLTADIIRNGVVAVHATSEEMARIAAGAAPYVAALEARRAQIPVGQARRWNDTSLPIGRDEAEQLYKDIRTALKRRGILDAAETYVGHAIKIKNLDVQINDPADAHWRDHFADARVPDPSTAYMHIDSVRRVKCMIYLTDVTDRTGPFSYVLGTHTIRLGFLEDIVRKANDISRLDRCDRDTRTLFSALPKMLQKKSEFGNDLLDSMPEVAELLAAEHFFTSDQGNLILFDNNGIHRGGRVLEGTRIILQVPLR